MSTQVPHLNRGDIEQSLEELYKRKRKRHLFAFHGTGAEDLVEIPEHGRVRIVPVRSELDLREHMPELGAQDDKIAFLVPWSGEMPMDLAGRFALGGRIQRIGRDARVRRLFNVIDVESGVVSSPLVDYLLRPGAVDHYTVAGSRLTEDAMWASWLKRDWKVPVEGGLARDTLLGWAATDGRGGQFRKAMEEPAAKGVREALVAYLSEHHGLAARLTFEAWERGEGSEILQWALLFETLAASNDAAVKMWVKQSVLSDFGVEDESERVALASALGDVASRALRYVQRHADEATLRNLIRDADGRVNDSTVRAALIDDNRLPSSWLLQLDALGALLKEGANEPTVERVWKARDRLNKLELHELGRDPSQTTTLRRATMAAKLMAWLAMDPGSYEVAGQQPFSEAEHLASWFAEDGGFVDWARRGARGSSEGGLGVGIQAVVEKADALRDELDRRFTKGLAKWVESGRPSGQVVPIDQAVRRIAIPFLKEQPSRKLLVLLLDGMAWAQAAEILMDLGSAGHDTRGPLAWHGSKAGRIGSRSYPAILANFPTVTEVSRSAFFAGEPMPAGKSKPSTNDDPKRWKANKDLAKLLDGDDSPQLLLRGESHTGDGSANKEALAMVASADRRVVAIVINAIDASLKADTQQHHRWTADSIRSLRDLLDKAREAGRAVLMASDHGHVPTDRMAYRANDGANGGARYRPWLSANDPVQSFEIGLTGSGVYAPKDAHGVVMVADECSRYGSSPTAGEHGGATLAEVVAPCVLVGCEQGGAWDDDPGQRITAPHSPTWWHLDLRDESVPTAEAAAPAAKASKKPKNEAQLSFLDKPKPEVAAAPAPPGLSAAAAALGETELFQGLVEAKERRQEILRAVDYLVTRHGVASGAAFAEAMGKLAWRVEGFVSALGEVLNVDGYQIIRYDHASRQVHLDWKKLSQQFEVKS